MDKNALMENRRETIIGLLKNMKIKEGSSGGFDKDDVYDCMQQLYDLYEKHIAELESSYEAEIQDLTKRYQKYDENNELYVSLIMEAKKSSNDIINQAREEVDEILTKGKKEIAEQEEDIARIHEESKNEELKMAESLRAAREIMEAEKAAMRMDVEAEKEKLEAVKIKYRQQISAMEGIFDEIKTNVLRTAGQLDGLKTQVEEVNPEEINWNLDEPKEKAVDVEFPDADVEVDDAVELPANETGAETKHQAEDLFAETFFKSEILEQLPKAEEETVAEADTAGPVIETPKIDIPAGTNAVEPVITTPAEELPKTKEELLSVEDLLEDISFDDLLSDYEDDGKATVEIPKPETAVAGSVEEIEEEEAEQINIEDLVDVEEDEDATKSIDEKPAAEEIPFEALEELFKEEHKE